MSRTPEQEKTCDASGRFTSSDPLVAFLYDLMKLHLPAGVVAQIAYDAVATRGNACEYTNGWLAQYAQHLSAALRAPGAQPEPVPMASTQGSPPEGVEPDCVCGHPANIHVWSQDFTNQRYCDELEEECECSAYRPMATASPPPPETMCGCENPECGGCYPP